MFAREYADVFDGDEQWNAIEIPEGDRYEWPDSTYVRAPAVLRRHAVRAAADARPIERRPGAGQCWATRITTDHISPAGAIKRDEPGRRVAASSTGVEPRDFNSYGSRRGNHEVMMRGTFANVRLRNRLRRARGRLDPPLPDGEEMPIFDAAMRYRDEGVPLVVIAGKEYGTGSSRDWAAKGTALLGVRAVIAASYERIHRSNLIGMGVLPLQFPEGEGVEGARADRRGDVRRLGRGRRQREDRHGDGAPRGRGDRGQFEARVRLDTPNEVQYFQHGGILQRVLRDLR